MARSTRWLLVATAALGVAAVRDAAAFPRSEWGRPSYEVEVVVNGVPLREYAHAGRYYVEGRQGDRYALRVRNNTGSRVEVVASVDGLDVVDGKKADWVGKRGYVIGPWQTYDIEGFRLDMGRVAAFRFSSVADSYAASKGDTRNVGVIGVAFFAERPRPVPVPRPVRPTYRDGDVRYGETRQKSQDERATAAEAAPPADAPAASASVGGGRLGGEGGATGYGHAGPGPSRDAVADRLESRSRPGLGTEFGESRSSGVVETTFRRASASTPTQVVSVFYNDHDGLLAMGVPVDEPWACDTHLRATANPFPANPPVRHFATPPAGWRED
jgi:hypothetical protein